MSESQPSPIIIDNGSRYTKVGYGGDDAPHCIFPTVVGKPKVKSSIIDQNHYCGDDAYAKRSILSMKYPYEHGIITHFDEYELLLQYIFFSQLRIDEDDLSTRSIVLTESIFNPKIHREKLTQIMFETFNINSLYFGLQPTLSLLSTGRTTGIVLDIGHGVTTIVPIKNALPIQHAICKIGYAGQDLDSYLISLLQYSGFSMTGFTTSPTITNIKETMCYVADDYNIEVDKYNNDIGNMSQSYELPDGHILTLGKQLFQCPEALFQPIFMGLERHSIQQCLHDTIMKCDVDLRSKLYNNIVLSGSTTKFRNFDTRLLTELKQLGHPDDVKKARIVSQSSSARDASFIGASILSTYESFLQNNAITIDEYNEYGPSCCDRKRNNISELFQFD